MAFASISKQATETCMSAADREAQEDELLALANIYAEHEFGRVADAQVGQLRACLELPQNFRIFVGDHDAKNALEGDFEVFFLPPVVLTFELPEDYPSTSAPEFKLSCKWLTPVQLSALCKQLDYLWEENKGRVVLFTWMQFLKEAALQHLNITSPFEVTVHGEEMCPQKSVIQKDGEHDTHESIAQPGLLDERALQDAESLDSLIRDILSFDEAQQARGFHCQLFQCNICFLDKLGIDCTQFKLCQHVYCNECLKAYFEVKIKEGHVHLLHCPEPECESVSTPAQVKQLVAEELFSRYDRLLLQSSLDSMVDVVYCPRLNCQTPVLKEPGGTMGICSNCHFVFCDLCKRIYHGVASCTQPEEKEKETRPNKSLAANSEAPVRKYNYKEETYRRWYEKASKRYIAANCKMCPACNVPIEKDGGCFRMHCTKCRTMYCWECNLPFTAKLELNSKQKRSSVCTSCGR
ncbi:E3 ubiquitin-protein ligase RNF14-like isoform X2 [Ambystoma mexicanum]|uniref:E3 ubiquitin-protein ligase RNF14-like isoform X2 n=1 Tax=Ambystoma mexicanum TaxID=8296 RepID=UPI0037E7F478